MNDDMCDSGWAGLHAALRLPDAVSLQGLAWHGDHAPCCAAEPLPGPLLQAALRRQTQFRAGRYCARLALARAGAGADTSADAPAMGNDGLPVWPDGWVGSISHTMGKAVALVAPASEVASVGVDVELWLSADRAAEIADSVALPADIAALAAGTGRSGADAVTLLFSAKEALYKTLYPTVRRFHDFDAARLAACGPDHVDLALTCDWHAQWPAGTVFRLTFATGQTWVTTSLCVPRSSQ